MQPQVNLIQNTVDDLVNSCQEMVEFRLPKTVWTRFLNEGLMDLYDVTFIEAEALLVRPEGQDYFILPDDFKQMYSVGLLAGDDLKYVPVASTESHGQDIHTHENRIDVEIVEDLDIIVGEDGITIEEAIPVETPVVKDEQGNDLSNKIIPVQAVNRVYLKHDGYEPLIWDIASRKHYDYIYANSVSNGTYSIFNGQLYINNYDGLTLDIKYFRKPAFLAAIEGVAKPIDIPNEYIEAVKLYACAQAMKAEDETDRYNLYYAQYRKKKEELGVLANRYRPSRQLYWKVRR